MTLNEFFANLEREVRNHSIYVWGRSGEKAPTITEAWIKKKENSTANANRAIKFWKKQVAAGYGDVLRIVRAWVPIAWANPKPKPTL